MNIISHSHNLSWPCWVSLTILVELKTELQTNAKSESKKWFLPLEFKDSFTLKNLCFPTKSRKWCLYIYLEISVTKFKPIIELESITNYRRYVHSEHTQPRTMILKFLWKHSDHATLAMTTLIPTQTVKKDTGLQDSLFYN